MQAPKGPPSPRVQPVRADRTASSMNRFLSILKQAPRGNPAGRFVQAREEAFYFDSEAPSLPVQSLLLILLSHLRKYHVLK